VEIGGLCVNGIGQADLILVGGKVITVDGADRIAEAVAVRAGRIYAVGSNAQIKALAGPSTAVVELNGRPLLPGFTDCHVHLEVAATALGLMCDLHVPPCKDVPSMMDVLRSKCNETKPGGWVFGVGNLFHDWRLPEKRYPTRAELDAVSTKHLIVLRLGMHITIMNSLAQRTVGLTRDTPTPRGGYIERDADGEPTGLCKDMYDHLGIPDFTLDQKRDAIKRVAHDYFLRYGVTAVGEVTETRRGVRLIQELANSGEMPLRVGLYMWVPRTISLDELLASSLQSGFGNDHVYLAGIKLFADGGISARLAAVHEPYHGTDSHGKLVWSPNELAEIVRRCNEAGLQLMIHGGGDRGMDTIMDAYALELDARPRPDHRWRIEHAGNLFGTDQRLQRMRDYDVVALPNPPHLHSVADHYESLVGPELAKHSMRLKSMKEMGFRMGGNSDLTGSQPESSNPLVSIWNVVSRLTFRGKQLDPAQKLTVMDGLRMYTIDSAYAIGQDRVRGSIEVGKLADLIVLDRDVLAVPEAQIKDVQVDLTYVDGVCVYQRGGESA
jgi:predicted amidohydrolase YtcJ